MALFNNDDEFARESILMTQTNFKMAQGDNQQYRYFVGAFNVISKEHKIP